MDNINDNKPTAQTSIEHPFVKKQVTNGSSKDQALSGFSLQSDMLTSAYINVDAGVLRQMLAAYQIKQTSKEHRAFFVGGEYVDTSGVTDINSAKDSETKKLDINAGNYPVDGIDLSGSSVKGIKLSGLSLLCNDYNDFKKVTKLLGNLFGVTLKMNWKGDKIVTSCDSSEVYLSLTSAVTEWVRIKNIIIKRYTESGDTDYSKLHFILEIDDTYCPRKNIGNGMSNQQIFLWCSPGSGKKETKIENQKLYQFSRHFVVQDGSGYRGLPCAKFNIDYIRDRYAIMHITAHLANIYHTATNMMLPVKLVSYLTQVKLDNLDTILEYISLTELLLFGSSNTTDNQKTLASVFEFIVDDKNYLSIKEGGNDGITIRGWNDKTDLVSTSETDRPTCLNQKKRKIKHVVVTNLPGMHNGRYMSTFSSSNMINGFFGSISLDMSYSDNHTPVDVNGMTVHQWNYKNGVPLDGNNDPSRWNVNANEDYYNLVKSKSVNC